MFQQLKKASLTSLLLASKIKSSPVEDSNFDLNKYYDISTVEDLKQNFELEGLAPVLKHSFSNDPDGTGNTPLHVLLEHWEDVEPEAVEMLIQEKGLDVNDVNNYGETALHGALLCYRDDVHDDYYDENYEIESNEYLYDSGENDAPPVGDEDWWSWWNGFQRKKRSLRENDTTTNLRTKRDNRDQANHPNFDGNHFLSIMDILFKNGLDLSITDLDNRNLFHCMARLTEDLRFENMNEILEYFHEKVDEEVFVRLLEEDDVSGNTAIDYAEDNGIDDILEWVYEHEFV
jgi:ankyrin repeat protein